MVDSLEKWRPVVGFEDTYEVSSEGQVRSLLSNRIMIGNKAAYRQVGLYHRERAHLPTSKRYTCRSVHRLVAEAFIGPRPDFLEVLHIDGDRKNNRASNLKYGTRAENCADTAVHGVHKGTRNGRHVLDERDVSVIKALLIEQPPVNRSAIARAFGVTRTVVGHIEAGRQWSHLDTAVTPPLV